jgi:hypothetical protein
MRSSSRRRFVQQFSDAHPRQHGIDHGGQCLRFGRGGRFNGSDVQTAVTQLDALEFAAPQLAGKAFQPPVEFGAAPGQPFVRRCWQAQLGRDRRHRRRGNR